MWEQLQSIGNWKPQTRLVCLPYISSLFVTDRDKFQEHFFSVVCLPHCQIWVSIEGGKPQSPDVNQCVLTYLT